MCTLDGCAPCFTAIRDKDGCNCRILATPPCKHAPFWLPSSQCSHPPADGSAMAVSRPSARPRMMAVIQPSQPFGRRMAVANSTQPSRRPDTSPGGSTLAPRATTPCSGWLASLSLSHRVGTLGQDLVSLAILRPMAATAVYGSHLAAGRMAGTQPSQPSAGGWLHWLEGSQNGACLQGGVARIL